MNGEQYPFKRNPTVYLASPFDATADANTLRKSMKGLGINEKAITNVICRRGIMQRLEIAKTFKTNYRKDLTKELKNKLRGNLAKVAIALMTPLPYLYAKELHNAVSGLGTDEETIMEILCTSNYGIRTICAVYEELYETSLDLDLKDDTSEHFTNLCASLCKATRDETQSVNEDNAKADAEALIAALDGQRTDKSIINTILANRSYQQLRQIFIEYKAIKGIDIEESIKNVFCRSSGRGMYAIVKCIKNKTEYFAERLYSSMKGLGTNDTTLIRIVVSRSEIDLGDIKQAFFDKYGQTLNSWIAGDTSGFYKKALFAIVN